MNFMKQSLSTLISLFFLFLILSSCQSDENQQDQNRETPVTPATNTDTSLDKIDIDKPGIAEDYTNTNRVIWQKPDMIIDLLDDMENKTIADIGAGTGFFAMRIAQKAKKVIAIDIDQRFIDYLDSVKVLELSENVQPKLEARLGNPSDPNLRPGEADVVIIVNTFMYIRDRVAYLNTLKKGISDNGKIIIVDFKKKRTPIGPPSEIRLPLHIVEDALYEAGYRNIVANDTSLDYQYIVTAQK